MVLHSIFTGSKVLGQLTDGQFCGHLCPVPSLFFIINEEDKRSGVHSKCWICFWLLFDLSTCGPKPMFGISTCGPKRVDASDWEVQRLVLCENPRFQQFWNIQTSRTHTRFSLMSRFPTFCCFIWKLTNSWSISAWFYVLCCYRHLIGWLDSCLNEHLFICN